MKAAALTYDQFDQLRGLVMPHLDKAMQYSAFDDETLNTRLALGYYVPVIFHDRDRIQGAMIMELTDEALHVVLLGGEFDPGWLDEVVDLLVHVAQSQSRHAVSLDGRRGWVRRLKPYGFREIELVGHDHYMRLEL